MIIIDDLYVDVDHAYIYNSRSVFYLSNYNIHNHSKLIITASNFLKTNNKSSDFTFECTHSSQQLFIREKCKNPPSLSFICSLL